MKAKLNAAANFCKFFCGWYLFFQIILFLAALGFALGGSIPNGCQIDVTTNFVTCNGYASAPCCAQLNNINGGAAGCPSSTYNKVCKANNNQQYCCDSCLLNLGVCVTGPGLSQTEKAPISPWVSVAPFTFFALILYCHIRKCMKRRPVQMTLDTQQTSARVTQMNEGKVQKIKDKSKE